MHPYKHMYADCTVTLFSTIRRLRDVPPGSRDFFLSVSARVMARNDDVGVYASSLTDPSLASSLFLFLTVFGLALAFLGRFFDVAGGWATRNGIASIVCVSSAPSSDVMSW